MPILKREVNTKNVSRDKQEGKGYVSRGVPYLTKRGARIEGGGGGGVFQGKTKKSTQRGLRLENQQYKPEIN